MPNIDLDDRWFSEAACRGCDPDLFFPDPDDPNARALQKDAESVCATCPVIVKCAEYALSNGEKNGTWGGKSSWGTSSKSEGKRYIQRLKLKIEYNKLQELPDSRQKRTRISEVVKQLNNLKDIHRRI